MIEHETLINFYNLYSKEIFNYCYHLTGVYEAAEDVLQDCFINLIEYSKKNVINRDRKSVV
jgi:DNA-directed RNA polymerase specialized sigma24 family protein